MIIAEGGTVVQFVGDAVMAIWGAPVRQPDHAVRAARAGIALHRAVAQVAASRPGWPRFRVGINTGPALVGNIGGAQMRNYTAIGDTTNLAARLEGRRAVLFDLRERDPGIDRFLTLTLAGYVRRLSAMVLDALYLPVGQRVTRRLADLADLYADPTGRAEIVLTQDDVASLAGTTRATANRVLRALESRGLVRLARGRIIVPDRGRLAAEQR